MAGRIHPGGSSPPAAAANSSDPRKPVSGTYVIQIPKDQIYGCPRPSNAHRFANPKTSRRSSCCCRFLCCTISFLLVLVLLAAAAGGVFYLVVRPKVPKYSVDRISITGFNLSAASPAISPSINVSVRAHNPNGKIKIRYQPGSAVNVYYDNVDLCKGKLPAFVQPTKNVTVFPVLLKAPSSARLVLSSSVKTALVRQQKEGKVPLTLKVSAPVKIKVGAVTTWAIDVKVTCDLTVNTLTANSKIVSKDCKVRVKLW